MPPLDCPAQGSSAAASFAILLPALYRQLAALRGVETGKMFRYANTHKNEGPPFFAAVHRELKEIINETIRQGNTTGIEKAREDIKARLVKIESCAQIMEYDDVISICAGINGHLALLMIRLVPANDTGRSHTGIDQAMDGYVRIAAQALRGHDMIARHGDNEIFVAMPNHSRASAENARVRIEATLEKAAGARGVRMIVETTDMWEPAPAAGGE